MTLPISTSFALVNSWQGRLIDANDNCIPRKKIVDLLVFQNEVALELIMCNKNDTKKCGFPSNDTRESPRKVHYVDMWPVNAVRYDGMHHWAEHTATNLTKHRKLKGYNSRTQVQCRKHNVFLWFSATNDCFYMFHKK